MPKGSQIVSAFLSAYESRQPPFPELTLNLTDHDMVMRHEYYRIDCQVTISEDGPDPALESTWRMQRRLSSLREELHDPVKALLGEAKYKTHFHPDARFAWHGGFSPYTEGKLKNWLARLADIINQGKVPAKVTETVLAFWMKPSFTPDELQGLPYAPWSEQESGRKLEQEDSGTSGSAALPVFATAHDDCPGPYQLSEESMVNAVADYTSAYAQEVTRLKVGTIVNVIEVMRLDDLKRVRARIAEPAGWISLLDTSDGYRWAKQHIDVSAGTPPPSSYSSAGA